MVNLEGILVIYLRIMVPRRGFDANQGPWPKYNHRNNNMLETHKYKASALFWYTPRDHVPTGAYLDQFSQTKGPRPWTGDPRYQPFSVRAMDSLDRVFVRENAISIHES